jgi:hypothetical protein
LSRRSNGSSEGAARAAADVERGGALRGFGLPGAAGCTASTNSGRRRSGATERVT